MIEKFISKVDIKSADIYKEYEFMYKKDNNTFHGIIDLSFSFCIVTDNYITLNRKMFNNLSYDKTHARDTEQNYRG